ncbi:MAG: VCBS repeat-containing protein [Chlorobi bacterium]|nr:VCBS repeat-containing protein [Chlorobiota bacterium]
MVRAVVGTGFLLLLFLSVIRANHNNGELYLLEGAGRDGGGMNYSRPYAKDSGKNNQFTDLRQACGLCHSVDTEGRVGDDPNHILNKRALSSREFWEADLNLTEKCGVCHTLVEPTSIPRRRWRDVIRHMEEVFQMKGWPITYEDEEWLDILHYYLLSSKDLESLPPDPQPSGLRFSTHQIGFPPDKRFLPMVGNVNIVDLDQNGEPDVLTTDFKLKSLSWIYPVDTGWVERLLARAPIPAKTEVFDFNNDGHLDIIVANIGSSMPTEELVGTVGLLINDGSMNFSSEIILDQMGRVADARPADIDNDGDWDFVIAVFGYYNEGEVGWLEQVEEGKFEYHRIIKKNGGIHVIPTNLNGDAWIDFIGVIAQEHEEIIGFVNTGEGKFEQHLFYKAFSPSFGLSGIELTDLDLDGDLDILVTNGDAIDLPQPMILPYHGIQWLENKGDMEYESHDIFSYYGAYRAIPGDLDSDGDLDILAVSLFNYWFDQSRMSALWFENDGKLNFTPHGIGADVTYLISADLADMDMDGDLDFVTAGMQVQRDPFNRVGRVTLWRNEGPMVDSTGAEQEEE